MWIVTGANGFIGSQLIRSLNSKGHRDVWAVDFVSPQQRTQPLDATFYSRFLDPNELLIELGKSSTRLQVQAVLHMGANSSTTERRRDHLLEVNTEYSKRIFEWCTSNQVPLIYASSAATYGAGEHGYNDETDSRRLKPLNYYGESKLLFDQWVLEQMLTPPVWYGLKFFNVYGPGEAHKNEMASVVFKAFHQISKTGKLQLFKSYHPQFKDAEQMRDFIYVKEISSWVDELLTRKPQSGIYNMGTGKARTWKDLAHAVFRAMGKTPQIDLIEMPLSLRSQYQYFTEAKMQKWQAQGLTSSKWSLELGVQDYVQNHLMKDKQ